MHLRYDAIQKCQKENKILEKSKIFKESKLKPPPQDKSLFHYS